VPAFNGFGPFWNYSTWFKEGFLPYRSFGVEYPPLGMASVILPGLFAANFDIYYKLFVAEMLIFDIAALFILAGLAKRLELRLWQTLSVYTIALLAIGRLISIRFDILPAVLTLFALYAFIKGSYKTAWAVIALGTCAKLYPAIIIPIFILYHLRHNTKKELIGGILTFAIVSAVICVPVLLLSPSGFLQSFTYQTGRGLQLETVYASFLLVFRAFNWMGFTSSYQFGAWQLDGSAADLLAKISTVLMVVGMAWVYWYYYLEQRGKELIKSKFAPLNIADAARIIKYSLLIVLVFILTNKVLSPQYLIWLLPFIPLISGRWKALSWVIFIMIGILTYIIYPLIYSPLLNGAPSAVGILFTRNILLVVLFLLVFAKGTQQASDKLPNNHI
jgi:uncharacterized membrane protein